MAGSGPGEIGSYRLPAILGSATRLRFAAAPKTLTRFVEPVALRATEFESRNPSLNRKGPRKVGLSYLVARPERFELPTAWFVARYSIQLSYGRVLT